MALPFAALHQLCAPMLDRVDALPGPQREAICTAFGLAPGASPDRLMIGLAVLTLLSDLSGDAPVLCVVDDAQWLDRESLQALTFVARRLQADPVAMVFASRAPPDELLAFPVLHLEGLNDADAQRLLSAALGAPLDDSVRDRLVAEAGGNPLALIEWPRGLTPAELAGGFGLPAKMAMSGQLEERYRQRLVELPPATQRLLVVAAAEPTGDPVILWRAAGALGVDPRDAAPATDGGFIELGVRVWFRHPLVRSAVYGAAPLEERQEAHRALAEATDAEHDPDRRAWHRALGAPGPDEDIAGALEHSADRARARGGLAAAGALLERSVALTVDPVRRGERLLAAADAHVEAGSIDTAGSLLALAESAVLDEVGEAQLAMLIARRASLTGDASNSVALLVRAAKRFEPLDLDRAAAGYLEAMATTVVTGAFAEGLDIGDVARAASSCPTPAEPTTASRLLAGLAGATAVGPTAASLMLREAIAAPATGETFNADSFHLLGYQCAAAAVLWDMASMQRFLDLQIEVTRDFGGLMMMPWALSSLAQLVTFEGDLERAEALSAEVRQIMEVTDTNVLPWAEVVVAGWRGDDGSARLIDEFSDTARMARLGHALRWAQWARATLHNSKGEYEDALAVAGEADGHTWEWANQHCFPELVEAAARCGQEDVAEAAIDRLATTVEPSGSDWGLGVLARSRALLATGDGAETLYEEAIDRLGRTTIRTELARAHLVYGEWLRREKRRVDAREHLRAAHEMFTAMGIHGFAERTSHELLATGETVRSRTVETVDDLTPQEAHIARLAADGRTNPEIAEQLFLSPRTVEWHLRKVFTKLDIASRRDLTGALAGA
jgi:DNA-binding CsgD family transcriptional regulator/tetratricopeptide (TPR) repeat protein